EQLPEIYRKLLQFRADLEYKRGNLSKALTNWHQVREQYRLAGTANESGYLVATHWVGYLSKELQQFDQAEAAYRETAEIAARTEGLNSNAYARALNYIGQVYSAMGQYGRETDVYRDGLQRLEKSGQQQTELAGVIWHNLGIAFRNAAKLEESAEAFDRAVAIRREFGDKWDLAVSRGEQTATLRRLERWMDALAANREAFEIDPDGRRKSRWKDDLEEIHRALIERVSAQGKYDLAVTVAAEMNENIRARFGAEHPRTQEAEAWLAEYRQTAAFDDRKLSRLAEANDATREAIQNQNKGDYDAAISQRRKALDICTELYGPESLRRAKQLEDLGLLQFLDWDISAARQSVQECLRIRERRIASKCQPVAEARLLLGHIAMGVEEYDAAEQECTAVLELLPEDTRSTARAHALIALGRMRRCQNRLIEADELLREAQQAAIATQEREAEVLVQALQSRAGLELMLGDLVAAERLASQAVDLARMRLGESAIIYGSALGTLADVKYERDENAEAERLYRDSLGIMEQRFGAESVMTARCINNLANVHLDRGDLVVAQTLYERAARTFLERQGRLSVDYALAVSNLGSVFRDRKQWPKAEENAREALTIVEEVAGQDSLDCRYRRGELLELLLLQRKVDHEASDLIRATLSYDEELVRQASRFQTERQQLTTQQSLRSTLDRYFSCGDALESPDEAYRHVLQWKGAVFTRQRQLRAAARRPESAGAFADWSRVTGQLATLSLRPPYPDEAEVWNHQIRLLTLRKDDLEYELLARAGEEERATPSVDEIRKALPERTALVDFLSYRDQLQLGSLQYVAFVVRPGEPTARVTIAKAAAINQQIDRWRVALDWDRQPDALEADREKLLELYSAASEQQTEAAAEIRTQLWHEIEPLLKGVDRVLISTDGDLAKFPWDALPGRNPESYLFEDYSLGMVPVPSLLPEVAKHASATGPAPLLTLLGNIDYGDQSRYATLAQRGQVESIELRGSLPFFFTALPGTIGETVSILGHFQKAFPKSQTVTLEGIDASEAAFRKHAVGSRWIHIATHGFFASDVMEAAVAHVPKARPGRVDESGAQPTALSAEDIGVHEGLMSGLALANANLLAGPHQDDGILSALEVATTDLDEVELAVLSACESGLGTNISGEGVLGLQRAFQVAGAASTITTLWPVDDEATRIFMDRFYDNLWVRKLPKSEALRETRQWFIDTSRKGWGRQPPIDPATLNGQSEVLPPRYASPEYWGAFVLSGDWN
ncbi:MAG: CHAT domain-containing protein, partial [Planctomycetaceae bacterium]|nr:CHAT domain-containing protein [Planctomycetaceae bacterium]